MTREEWLIEYAGTVWEGGRRYWRGAVMYRPTWTIVDLEYRHASYDHHLRMNLPPAWLAVIERVDDNSSSEPRGTRRRMSLQCFEDWGPCPHLFRARTEVFA